MLCWCRATRRRKPAPFVDYNDARVGEGPHQELGVARRIAQLSYRSRAKLELRFGRSPQIREDPFTWKDGRVGGRFAIASSALVGRSAATPLDHQRKQICEINISQGETWNPNASRADERGGRQRAASSGSSAKRCGLNHIEASGRSANNDRSGCYQRCDRSSDRSRSLTDSGGGDLLKVLFKGVFHNQGVVP